MCGSAGEIQVNFISEQITAHKTLIMCKKWIKQTTYDEHETASHSNKGAPYQLVTIKIQYYIYHLLQDKVCTINGKNV